MTQQFYHIKERIQFRFRARHQKGFGIHSPYLYRLITSVLKGKYPYYYFRGIESMRKDFNKDSNNSFKKKFITRRRYKKEAHCGQIIFRIIQDAQFETLLELGTTTGMETQYMALANQKARCVSVTESVQLATEAQKGFLKQELQNIELRLLKPEETPGTVISELDNIDFVLFNQIDKTQDILDAFNQCLLKKSKHSIFVFMRIHGNTERGRIWKEVRKNPEVQVTIDLFNLGVMLFNPELEKRNYVIRSK